MANIKRDSKGRFIKGKSANPKKQFSSTRQPKNPGRKPSRFKKILESLDGVGQTISQEDYERITKTLLTMTGEELSELAQDKSTPIAIVLVANAINGDLNNQRMDNLEKLLDRVFGKSTNKVDVTSKGDKVNQGIQIEILDAKDKDK